MAGTCPSGAGSTPRNAPLPGARGPPRPSGAALRHSALRERGSAALLRSAAVRPAGLGTPPGHLFRNRDGRKDGDHGPPWVGGCRRPDPGLACPYRSESVSPPQCCGPRTRTKAPPFSRQGTRQSPLTLAGNQRLSPWPRDGVERARAMPRGLLGTPPLRSRPDRGAGRENKTG